jgi:hypothetical protein
MFKRRPLRWGALFAACSLQIAGPSWAEVTAAVAGSARYEHESNVFDLQSGNPVLGTSDFQHSDRLYTYGAAVDVDYLWERQKLFAILSDNQFRYDHFTQLNHNEYNLDVGLNWKLGRLFDGTLESVRSRTMVAFTNVVNSRYELQTDQRNTAIVGLEFMPDWRLEGTGTHHTNTQDSVGQPVVDLTEKTGTLALQYRGRAGLTAGVLALRSNGDYTGDPLARNPSYRQTALSLTAMYALSGRASLNSVVGYSDRKSGSAANSISGFTGELDFEDQLTGKTSMHVLLSRNISNYVANVASEIDDAAALTLRWQTTYRLGVIAGYNWTKRDLPGQNNQGSDPNRVDHQRYTSLNLDYQFSRWLTLKPYINYQTRSSNYLGGNFSATVYGIYFAGQWQNQRQPDAVIQRLNLPAAVH